MASVSIGVNRGPDVVSGAVTVGTVTATGNDIVLAIDATKHVNSGDLLRALEVFKQYIENQKRV